LRVLTAIMREKVTFKGIWSVLKQTFGGFSEHKILKLSGALAYYMVFSMGPLLILIISLCGLFLQREAIEGEIYRVLQDFVGSDTASQLQQIIKNAAVEDKSGAAIVVGGVVLLIGATTVFAEIQDSINTIWGIKPKPKRGWLKYLQNRFLSFSVIVSLGFLLLVSLAVSTLIEMLSNHLKESFPDMAVFVLYSINLALSLGISVLIFATIFKVLPDARIKWRDVFMGAFVTAILFMGGKFGISFYISQTKVGSTYGGAGSLVVLLVWVYYSAVILYIGAEFTKAYAIRFGSSIRPSDYAVTIRQVTEETNDKILQPGIDSN
jgi:membrane protein